MPARITGIRVPRFSCPLPEPLALRFWGGVRTIVKRDGALVAIDTDEGVTGYGTGPTDDASIALIERVVAPALLGHDPTDIDGAWRKGMAADGPGLPAGRFARRRALGLAVGAVDVALYDLKGRLLGQPIRDLIGPARRDRVRVYGSAGMYQPAEGYAREARELAGLGFRAYKFRPAIGPQKDIEAVHLIRRATDPDFAIMLDAHPWWSMGEWSYPRALVKRLARDLEELDVYWLEEPLARDDLDGYRELAAMLTMRVAGGEGEPLPEDFAKFITTRAVDVVNGDVGHGGITGALRIAAMARAHGLEYAPHNWGIALQTLANAHVLATMPEAEAPWLEFPCFTDERWTTLYPFPGAYDCIKQPLTVESGELVLPLGPGLGVEIDETVVERYPYLPGPWT
jgi:L-alanine-DL-glutamate epimerase-like enolase superfamily enzyme